MILIAKAIGAAALAATLVAPLLFLAGQIEQDATNAALLVATAAWFAAAAIPNFAPAFDLPKGADKA